MPNKLSIDIRTTALLVMDFQTLIVENYSEDKDTLLVETAKLLKAAREKGIIVIYVSVSFRPGFPEISARNMTVFPRQATVASSEEVIAAFR